MYWWREAAHVFEWHRLSVDGGGRITARFNMFVQAVEDLRVEHLEATYALRHAREFL